MAFLKYRVFPVFYLKYNYHLAKKINNMKTKSITFNGFNIDEIANFTGRNVKMSTDTETRNCSEKFPEGFDYPYAQIESPDGWINLSLHKSIDKNLIIH